MSIVCPVCGAKRDPTTSHACYRTTKRRGVRKPSPSSQLSSGFRPRTPGWQLVRRAQKIDGISRDAAEAAQTFVHEPWASSARYLGVSSGIHCWERPPEAVR